MKIILLPLIIAITSQLNGYHKYPSQYATPSLLYHPLHYFASKGYCELLEQLIDSGDYNVDSSDHLGRTPIHCAAAFGQTHAMFSLIFKDAKLYVRDNYGLRPKNLAYLNGHKELGNILKGIQSSN